jgi:hypothetical protein
MHQVPFFWDANHTSLPTPLRIHRHVLEDNIKMDQDAWYLPVSPHGVAAYKHVTRVKVYYSPLGFRRTK